MKKIIMTFAVAMIAIAVNAQTVWEGPKTFYWGDETQYQELTYDWNTVGEDMYLNVDIAAFTGADNSWLGLVNVTGDYQEYYNSSNDGLAVGATTFNIKLTDDILSAIKKNGIRIYAGGNGDEGFMVKKVYLSKIFETVTTLWEGIDDGSDIYVAKEKLTAGATITLEFNWLGTDGAQFSCFYWDPAKGAAGDWETLYNWQWVNNGETYSFSLTQEQIDAIPEHLDFKTNVFDKMTFKRITSTAKTVDTGITTVQGEGLGVNDSAAYNLSGQRVANSFKGIIIRGGKKYTVK
ncbi:MAG: hypothetical protein ACI4B3_01285 [Prevotella sp.]